MGQQMVHISYFRMRFIKMRTYKEIVEIVW